MNEQSTPTPNTPTVPPPAPTFIKKKFDEFTNNTTIEHTNEVSYEAGDNSKTPVLFVFQLWQSKSKDAEILFLNCWATKSSEKIFDRFRASEGKMIFNCDQENFELKCREAKTEQSEKETKEATIYLFKERVYYVLKPEQLKQICEAKVLKLRISGKDSRSEPKEEFCREFQKYCKQFYNNVFDSSLYTDALIVEKPKSGCFVATACYGNYDHPIVMELRHFRDNSLEISTMGRAFVRFYYKWSPTVASFLTKSKTLKTLAKVLVVDPAVVIARMVKQR